MTDPTFRTAIDEGVAVITFDEPGESVNTLSPEMAREFEQRFDEAQRNPAVQAVVFISGKKDNFIAGAKLQFFQSLKTAQSAEEASKSAQENFNHIAHAPKPVVAAIHGSCLGGGLEWALACHYRVGSDSPKTSLGLPEVQLGLLPGAGGTQRLPRLIGLPAALDLILAGKTVRAQKAKRLGILDEVVPQSILLDVAKRRALELAEGKLAPSRRDGAGFGEHGGGLLKRVLGLTRKEAWAELAFEDNPLGRKIVFEQARKQVLKRTRGKYPAPEKALEAIRVGMTDGFEEGLKAEARLFGELAATDVSKRLIELFFATTSLKKETGAREAKVKAKPVKKVGVLGSGLMGAGIAYVTAANVGIPVRLKDKDDAGIGRGLKQIRALFDERVKRRALTSREAAPKMALVTGGTDYRGFENVDVIIEAVFEDLALKRKILSEVEAVTKEGSIFASNTSSLPIAQIAAGCKRPQSVIGMHYFSPVNKMMLLEIIVHPQTADEVTATCVALGKKQGKTVIVVNDGPGFYTTRIIGPYMNEAAYLLSEGASVEDLDEALLEFGFPVGPITLLDEVGIDVGAKVGHVLHQAFGERMAPPEVMDKIIADGRQGRKNRRGFYVYTDKKGPVDSSVYALFPQGTNRQRLDRQEMAERCVLQFVNEAVRCLGDGILRNPRDGDIGAVLGLGFPPFLGGPFRYADWLGATNLVSRLSYWRDRLGPRFEPAPRLVELAQSSGRFYPE